jgi:prepilin-type processing-associated H-X9-DG protein
VTGVQTCALPIYGTSETIIVAEDTGRGWKLDSEWANGQNIFDETGPINVSQNNEMWSDHRGGVNAAFCDGSAHFLSQLLDVKVVEALCTRDSGEVIDGKVFQ